MIVPTSTKRATATASGTLVISKEVKRCRTREVGRGAQDAQAVARNPGSRSCAPKYASDQDAWEERRVEDSIPQHAGQGQPTDHERAHRRQHRHAVGNQSGA